MAGRAIPSNKYQREICPKLVLSLCGFTRIFAIELKEDRLLRQARSKAQPMNARRGKFEFHSYSSYFKLPVSVPEQKILLTYSARPEFLPWKQGAMTFIIFSKE